MSSLTSLAWLKNDSKLSDVIEKVSLGGELADEDLSYILAVSILFVKEYQRDARRTSYLEFGYFLVLIYSLNSDNFHPLFDLSTNLGFYPISKYILEHNILETNSIYYHFIEESLLKFKNNNITETFEQNKFRNEIIKSSAMDSCYIAPTSFGKSSLMVELIRSLSLSKVAIIVPTKSLLTQTYRLINENFEGKKVIFHDEMYDDEVNFIAVFTQERALRLLKSKKDLSFDALLIDEAHNLFESSSRSILLSRLIRRVRKRSIKSRIFYFSPLINDGDNLRFEEKQIIESKCIQFNVKEPEIFEYRLDGKSYLYNRFLNKYFNYKSSTTMLRYVIDERKLNNFIYLRAPKKVEAFAGMLSNELPLISGGELSELADTIAKNVHEEFYCVDLVRKGVIYIHGKLPDLIKEYLEYKFNSVKSLSFLVANSVILEGVNLPIDNLYVLNTYDLGAKELTNLIGRVNRLNDVFSGENSSLSKLMPSVHFVNSEEFNRERSNMSNKIELLRSGISNKDEIKNPTLLNFDIDKFNHIIKTSTSLMSIEQATKVRDNALFIQERELFLVNEPASELDSMKSSFIESGLHYVYSDFDTIVELIFKKIEMFKFDINFMDLDPIDKIYLIFIKDFESTIIDLSFIRLKNEKARNFYKMFVRNIHALSLKEHINSTVKYFYKNADETGNSIFYIGSSYGEVAKDGTNDGTRTYINLSTKGHKELVNLSLVKIKMESDFVSYKLNDYVSILKDLKVVSESEYNLFIYGTSKKRSSDLIKLGFSGSLIRKLEHDDQLKNINVDSFGRVSVNVDFNVYLKSQDDLIKFEVNKYISM